MQIAEVMLSSVCPHLMCRESLKFNLYLTLPFLWGGQALTPAQR